MEKTSRKQERRNNVLTFPLRIPRTLAQDFNEAPSQQAIALGVAATKRVATLSRRVRCLKKTAETIVVATPRPHGLRCY
jgi:hypothetical protein